MTNKKFKIAAMSLALTACVAASPLAANAESADAVSDTPSPAAQSEPEAPAAAQEAPEQEAEAASEKEEAAQPAADVAVLPAAPEAAPVVVETPAEETPEEEAPAEETPAEETPEEEAPAEESPAEEPEEPEAPAQSAEEEEPEQQEPAADSDAAAPAEDIIISLPETPAVSPLLPGADNAVSSDAQISLLLPTEEGAVALVDNTVATVINKNGEIAGDYQNFDDAVAAAKDGDTILVTRDTTSANGLDIRGIDLTIQGKAQTVTEKDADGKDVETTVKPKLTLNKGIALRSNSILTFKDMEVLMEGVGATPATDFGWTWMTVCAQNDVTLTLDNTDMTMDGTGTAAATHGIYFCGNDKLNVQNGSNLTIKNYTQDAMEWDGGDGGYNCNITGGSTVTSDHNRSGFAGTFGITVDGSTLNVINSRGNGSNGSHFDIKNGSKVDFSNNAVHGLSAGNLTIKDSTVTANNNGYNGIIFTGKGTINNSTVTITGTKGKSYWNAGMRLLKGNATMDITNNSTVTIKDNDVSGIFCDGGSKLTIDDSSNVTITGNNAAQENCSSKKDLAQSGGGLVVCKNAQAKLGAKTTINNNHAALAGDDIFVEEGGKLTFSVANAGIGDTLNDCGDKIDGWYTDANGQRWNFHAEEGEEPFFQNLLDSGAELTKNADGTYTITAGEGGLALKAAHAELPAPEPDPEPTPDPDTPDTPVSPEDPTNPPVQDATPDEAETPVTPENPTNPPVQDATPDSTVAALPKTGVNWFTALAMALSGMALTVAGAFTSLFAKSKH